MNFLGSISLGMTHARCHTAFGFFAVPPPGPHLLGQYHGRNCTVRATWSVLRSRRHCLRSSPTSSSCCIGWFIVSERARWRLVIRGIFTVLCNMLFIVPQKAVNFYCCLNSNDGSVRFWWASRWEEEEIALAQKSVLLCRNHGNHRNTDRRISVRRLRPITPFSLFFNNRSGAPP